MNTKMLVEKWEQLIDADKVVLDEKKVGKKDREVLAQLLEAQEKSLLSENSATALGDIGVYTQILVPAVRRMFPNMIGKDLVGVQPLSAPTSFVCAIRNSYVGAGGKKNLNGTTTYPGGAATTTIPHDRLQQPDQAFGGAALVLKGAVPCATGVNNFYIDVTGAGTASDEMWGSVVLAQYDPGQNVTKILIDITKSGADSVTLRAALVAATLTTTKISCGSTAVTLVAQTATITDGTNTAIVGFFNNEAGYNLIFGTAYNPYESTASAEYKARADMKQMKVSIEKFAVEVATRTFKVEYSLELVQDAKSQWGVDIEAELINLAEYEIAAELDRDIVDSIHHVATNAGQWFYGQPGVLSGTSATLIGSTPQTSDGRYEMEKFRTLYTRILREANFVQLQTRRGKANFIIASLNVVTALETLSNFMYAGVPGNIDVQIGVAKVGTLDGQFSVYLDTFAFSDFFIVGYKGSAAMDTGIVYCPYVPLQMVKITDPSTLQPAIGFKSRDSILGSIWGADKYYRKVYVDFTGSSLISESYYW